MDAAAAFQAVIDRYRAAYARRDATGCAALYAGDGAVYSPFGPVAKGRAEIAATHRDWFEAGETGKEMVVTDAGMDGDLGYCLVRFAADVPGEGESPGRLRGISLNVMRRGADGIWTISLTSLNELQDQTTDQDP